MSQETAVAGVYGPDVRSDCRVLVQPATGDAPLLTLYSRVDALYGESIRSLVRSTLEALDATDLAVTIDDSGALPYVIAARVEAAVRRLRPALKREALPPRIPSTAVERLRLRRSRLYLPGNTPKFFINAGLHQPDAVILDLEDSVPRDEKDAARILVRNALRAVDFHAAERFVRVNAPPDGWQEIELLAPHGVDAFLLPKVEDAATVAAAAEILDRLDVPDITLIPIIESARGVLNAFAIASASPRVSALAIGLEDYTADIGAQRTPAGRESLWAQSQIVNAARAAGVQPLASVYSAIDDETGLRSWLAEARGLGFTGAGCVHPRQVRIVHAMFRPSAAEVEQAQRIVTAFEASGGGAIAVDGQMVDAPVVARARRVLWMAGAGQ